MPRVSRAQIRTGLALVTLAALIGGSRLVPASADFSLAVFLVGAGVVAFCCSYPIRLHQMEFNLAHAVGLGMLFTFGLAPAMWSVSLGLIIGYGVRVLRPEAQARPPDFWKRLTPDFVRQGLPLVAASGLYLWLGGRFPLTAVAGETVAALGAFSLAYFALYNLFLALELDGGPGVETSFLSAHLGPLSALELAPLLLAVFVATRYASLGSSLLLTFGGVLMVVTASLHSLSQAQARLKQQAGEHVRLYAETQRHTEAVSRLLDIASRLSAILNTEDALALICPSAMRILGAPGAALFLLDTDRAELVLAYAEGLSAAFVKACGVVSLTDPGGSALVTIPQPQLVINLRDAAHNPPAGWDKHMEAEGLRAYVSLALQARGEPLGALVAYFPQPPDFPSWTMDVLRAFGSQASLTIANTQLYERTKEALARRVQRWVALTSISRELSATLDLQPLFDAIIVRAVEGAHASLGRLGIVEAATQSLRLAAGHGLPPTELLADWPTDLASGIAGRVLQTGQAELRNHIRRDSDKGEARERAVTRSESQLCVPIVHEERRLGVLLLESEQPDAFSAEDQEFVEQIAVQAAIALDNARLYTEANTRLREQSILYEAGSALTALLDRRTIYLAVAQKLAEAVGADDCVISDYALAADVVKTVWRLKTRDDDTRSSREYRLADFPSTAHVLRERAPLVVQVTDPQADPAEAALLQVEGYRSVLALPMVASDQVVGLVELYTTQSRSFEATEIRLAQTLANQAAIALENARLFRRVTEGRDRLAAVLNSTREGVLVVDASGLVSLVNPRLEEFWGIPAGRLLGQDLPGLLKLPELDIAAKLGFPAEEILELLQTLRAGLALAIPKAQYHIPAPKARFLERSGEPVLDQFGKAIGWVIILRDVTEEKEIQEVREALSNMIVHDLRSPLTAVLASTAMLREHVLPSAQSPVVTQALEVATRSTNKMIGLVNTLLDIARMESGEISLQRTPVNLDALVDEVVAELMPLAAEQGIILLNEVPPLLPRLLVDREKVSRVFTNLIDNALKFTPPGGRIWIRGGYAAPSQNLDGAPLVLCEVLDTGPGIPEDYQDKIFDRFVQIRGRAGRREGTGLGLAFCKLTVEAHGGKIWAENRPGGGSAFYFTLPVEGDSKHGYASQLGAQEQSVSS